MMQPQTEQEAEVPEESPSPVPEAKGSCFLNQDRICGSDCMAYLTTPPQDAAYVGQQWARCLVLLNVERGGKHLVVLASVGTKLVASRRQDEREKKAPGVG